MMELALLSNDGCSTQTNNGGGSVSNFILSVPECNITSSDGSTLCVGEYDLTALYARANVSGFCEIEEGCLDSVLVLLGVDLEKKLSRYKSGYRSALDKKIREEWVLVYYPLRLADGSYDAPLDYEIDNQYDITKGFELRRMYNSYSSTQHLIDSDL